jgi:hypothetical protein
MNRGLLVALQPMKLENACSSFVVALLTRISHHVCAVLDLIFLNEAPAGERRGSFNQMLEY